MHARIPLVFASREFVLIILLVAVVACTSPAPTPSPIPPTAAVRPTQRPTFTPHPSATWTSAPTETALPPTSTDTPSSTPTAKALQPPAPPAKGGVVDNQLWFMSQLITYFSQVGQYPPEPPITRPADVNPLTGLTVSDPAVLGRRVILARVMNDPSARPQTGLNEADLVIEELIDQRNGVAALTRFTAVYLGIPDATIRPLRSVRLINPSLTDMFDGVLVHSGASKGMNFLLSKIPITSIGEDFQHTAFCAIGASTKTLTWAATTVAHLHDYMRSKGWERSAALRGFDFSDSVPAGTPAASIGLDHLPFPVKTVGTVVWNFDENTGKYLRFANGIPHNSLQYQIAGRWGGACEETTKAVVSQVQADNVVVINAPHHPTDPNDFTEDTNKFTNIFIELTGSGPVKIFRDGVQVSGTWRRASLQHFFEFLDASGNKIALKPGNSWIEVVPINYAPTVR